MNIEDRIIELNFDTDNEEAQEEAKALKKKIKKQYLLFFISSIALLLLSIAVFILFAIFAIKKNEVFILYSIIPLVTLLLSIGGIVIGLNKKNLADEIIIEDEKNERI